MGLLVLHAEDRVRPWLDAETVSWMGVTDRPDVTGDVLSLSVRARDRATGSEVRGGRMLVATGSVRPLHLDGLRAFGRLSTGTTAELFGGAPVVRRFSYDDVVAAVGGRLGQTFGDRAAMGVAYLHRRRASDVADEEVGADVALTPRPWLTAAGRFAYDLVNPGATDALASVSVQKTGMRAELFGTYRSPGRMLPSTSLFSVLGDFAATTVGGTARYRMFPRLEVVATGSGQVRDAEVGGQGIGRVTLALDDAWTGTVGVEGRRVDFAGARWTGARVIVGKPVSPRVRVATELELVVPDRPRGRGAVWPWALAAVSFHPTERWDVAAALEASSGPENRSSLAGLLRGTWAFEVGRR